ncbi:papain-like cysteine peptidase [Streptomyces sp. SM14]|uniref:papain-like cysteine peptidase n=1 Tax=Streptomyces sp. SM14 TaxID=1736045 RepID=UPI000CD4EE2D|nr:papain-like cysteine peptidase [Streptomyces sp. SM14]
MQPTPSTTARPRPFDDCVGLGYHCEVTHQIRRVTGNERAAYFDWLDLDLEAVIETIEADFTNVLRPGLTEPFGDGLFALDRGSGIRFFHEFAASGPKGLSEADIERQIDAVRAKFTHLADRFRSLATSDRRVLYIRNDAFDEHDAADLRRLRAAIATQYPGHRFALLWLRRTVPADAAQLPPGIAWGAVPLVPGRWEGDDAAWDAAFDALDPAVLWPRP